MRRQIGQARLFSTTLIVAAITAGGTIAEQDDAHEIGRDVFVNTAQPSCATCHILADADASGRVGPSLDQLAPEAKRVRAAVTKGIGIMPAFGDTLSDDQIEAVALYVSDVAGSK